MITDPKNSCFYRLESIEYKTQKYKNVPKKNKDGTFSVNIKYLGIYSKLSIAEKAMRYYIEFENEYCCFVGFRILKEYVNNMNHVKESSWYEPDMTYIYNNNGNYITKLEGMGRNKDYDKDVYFGIDPKRIALERGDFVVYLDEDKMIQGIVIEKPTTKKEWKKQKLSPSNDYDAYYVVASKNSYDHVKITDVYQSLFELSKDDIQEIKKDFIKLYCGNELDFYNKNYKKIFDKLINKGN